jgi:hypothetical protein
MFGTAYRNILDTTSYEMLLVMQNVWYSLQEYFNRDAFRSKMIRTSNSSHENYF